MSDSTEETGIWKLVERAGVIASFPLAGYAAYHMLDSPRDAKREAVSDALARKGFAVYDCTPDDRKNEIGFKERYCVADPRNNMSVLGEVQEGGLFSNNPTYTAKIENPNVIKALREKGIQLTYGEGFEK